MLSVIVTEPLKGLPVAVNAVGVPLTTPDEEMLSPAGSEAFENTYGAVPPVATMVVGVYAMPTCP